jgi:hypothetical protein
MCWEERKKSVTGEEGDVFELKMMIGLMWKSSAGN